MRVEITQHGLKFGSLEIVCCCSDEKKGWVVVELHTPKAKIEVYATRTGKVRLLDKNNANVELKGGKQN